MPILNYKEQFAIKVVTGEKKQTVRGLRKYLVKVGDRLYHYTGLRTKNTVKLGESWCTEVKEITMYSANKVEINGRRASWDDCHELARRDGFESWWEMYAWFKKVHSMPFHGQVITWYTFKPAQGGKDR